MNLRQPGEQIEVVFRIADDPFIVMPVTVVQDTPDRIAHYIARGTRFLRRQLLDGSPVPRVVRIDELRRAGSRLEIAVWRSDQLVVIDPVSAHGVRLRWSPETWAFQGWYVNLQQPLERTDEGFTTEDQFLDIVVKPDLPWTWKDEDELELAVQRGRLKKDEAVGIRREGDRVIQSIESREFPFDDSLIHWRPDPVWTVPVLRDEWKSGT